VPIRGKNFVPFVSFCKSLPFRVFGCSFRGLILPISLVHGLNPVLALRPA
jgi:hypothetical protein